MLSLEYSQTGRDQYKIFGFLDSFLELKTNNCYFEFIIDQFLDYLLLSLTYVIIINLIILL